MKISKTAAQVETSLTRALFNLAKNYTDVIDFTLGDPDLKPLKEIRQAGIDAIEQGRTRYSANAGLPDLRRAVAGYVERLYGRKVDPEREVMITVGAMEGLYLSLLSMLDPGDEVMLIAPYYVNYLQMTLMCGGKPVIIDTDAEDGFRPDLDKLEAAITARTAAIIINNPCNPSGKVWTAQEVEGVARIAASHGIALISDEVYRSLIYEGEHHSIMSLPELAGQAVLIDSFSKEFCMTGWRLGYAIANEALIAQMTRLQENVAACAPLPSQYAGIAALTDPAVDTTSILNTFRTRRNYLYDRIAHIPGLKCAKPAGTFYLFIDISELGMASETFARELIQEEHVAVVPGVAYGQHYDNYIRMAYTVDTPVIEEGVTRMERFVRRLMERDGR